MSSPHICTSVILLLEKKMQRAVEPLEQLLIPSLISYQGDKVMYRCAINGNFQKSLSLAFHVASWHKDHVLFVLQIYIHNYKSIYHPHQLQ